MEASSILLGNQRQPYSARQTGKTNGTPEGLGRSWPMGMMCAKTMRALPIVGDFEFLHKE
jgi:hypothetical protein